MTGEDLYEIWADAMRRQSIDVQPWSELTLAEQAAWDATASTVVTELRPPTFPLANPMPEPVTEL